MWEWNDFSRQDLMIESENFMHNGGFRRRPTRVVGKVRITRRSRTDSNAQPLSCNAGFQNDERLFNTESGHIFGLQLGGVNTSENVVPMYAHVNRGLFREVERDIVQAYRTGQNYGLEYSLAYGDVNEPRLPTAIRVNMLRNFTITGLGAYTADTTPAYTKTVRQDPPVITRIAIDPELLLLFTQAREAVAHGWTLETSCDADHFRQWAERGALPAVDRRPYAFLDYILFELPYSDTLPMAGIGTIGPGRGFSEAQRGLIAMANRYVQPEARRGECWSDAPDDPIKVALLQLGADTGYEIDHIMPKSLNGSNAFSNAQLTSRRFNGSKSNTLL
jgi:hypothetical protein